MILTCFQIDFYIEENEEAFVSPYSMFMIENYPLNINESGCVCDFGSGTGVLGIVASVFCKNKIVYIEKNPTAVNISQKNYRRNNIENICTVSSYCEGKACNEMFDTIICNPASLPDIADVNSFCNGGQWGMDMIMEVLDFSHKHLKKNGKLYIIVTSILPRSIAENFLRNNKMQYKVYAKKIISFRKHYDKIKEWVDSNKAKYNEMYYLEDNNQYYEELYLWEVCNQ